MASNTGASSPGDLLIISKISVIAASRSRASHSSAVRVSILGSSSDGDICRRLPALTAAPPLALCRILYCLRLPRARFLVGLPILISAGFPLNPAKQPNHSFATPNGLVHSRRRAANPYSCRGGDGVCPQRQSNANCRDLVGRNRRL